MNGVARNAIARLNADGTLDTGFNPNVIGVVYCVAVQTDGKIVLAGNVSTVGSVLRNNIMRFNADGSLDTGFDPNANQAVSGVAVQEDGKIVIGGVFTSVGGVAHRPRRSKSPLSFPPMPAAHGRRSAPARASPAAGSCTA